MHKRECSDDRKNKESKLEAEELQRRIRIIAKKEIKKFIAAFKLLLNKQAGGR